MAVAIAMGWHKPDNVAGSAAPAIMLGFIAAAGGILFGYDTGAINGILAMTTFNEHFKTGYVLPNARPSISPMDIALVVSILSLGATLGSLISAPLGDHLGRRRCLIGGIGVFCFGAIFQIIADRLQLLLVGRFFAGVGVGMVSVLVPLYQSEMAPKWIRGTLVCAYQLSITLGLFVAAVVNCGTNNLATAAAYRIPIGLQFIWAFVLALAFLMLPETPRYLIKRGDKDSAAMSLSRLRRLDITHPALLEELAEIEANHQYELALGPDTYKELVFGTPHLGQRLLTGCCLQMIQQLSGINFIMYYGTTFFNNVAIDNPFLIALIMQLVNMVSTLPGLLVVETWGRRILLIVGAIGMAICQNTIGIIDVVTANHNLTVQNQILIIFVSLYIFCFAASWGPVAWVVTAEIYPLKVRAKAMSITTASNWLLNFGIAYGTPFLVDPGKDTANLGAKVFFVWGAFCIIGAIFVWFMVFETSKMSLEQIDEMYERVDYAWNSKKFEPSWSFQQMRDLGYSDSGIPPEDMELQLHQLQPASSTSTSATSHTTATDIPGSSGNHATSHGNKSLPHMANVDFSY